MKTVDQLCSPFTLTADNIDLGLNKDIVQKINYKTV